MTQTTLRPLGSHAVFRQSDAYPAMLARFSGQDKSIDLIS
jgi:hypothetical protein